MDAYYVIDEWSVVEDGFDPSRQESSESIFSLGNGHMGLRANFEERYSGASLQGTYIAGIYYPDKTRVGWWKNGYPEYFAKVPNTPSWINIHIRAGEEEFDLHTARILQFRRELNMKHGFLERSVLAEMKSGTQLKVVVRRFVSMAEDEIGAVRYSVIPVNFTGKLEIISFLDGGIVNRDANYDEKFWDILTTGAGSETAFLHARTRKSGFDACFTAITRITHNRQPLKSIPRSFTETNCSGHHFSLEVSAGDEVVVYKYVSVLDSLRHTPEQIIKAGETTAKGAAKKEFDHLFEEHAALWNEKWAHSDIIIEGDASAQQGIRFAIFHLNQTYTGRDERLNIGPKGFTGEKYGGSTYWDTEAFLIHFYLSTEPEKVARNLLIYRYKHLKKAIENASRLGFGSGAALYPMVTMNGEECHNEWEITFEEIHRNGAIAFAIYTYIRYTGDKSYLTEYGLEVLIALSRFWQQRVNWSEDKKKYVILGVTGPNEYENNVNNNWYTNRMASWTLKYTLDSLEMQKKSDPDQFKRILEKTNLRYTEETGLWQRIIENMYFPVLQGTNVFLQQDGYMDKEQRMAFQIDPAERPINQHWSWDRILRSVFIKQADVLQGIFCFEDDYTTDVIRENFEFYEPRTVHESSLSPCIHSILANRIGKLDTAYSLYLRTSRLDLEDYNKEVAEGLHITSMGGTWMSIVIGFGGMRVVNDQLSFRPNLPANWKFLSFTIRFRNRTLKIGISPEKTEVSLIHGDPLQVEVNGKQISCRTV